MNRWFLVIGLGSMGKRRIRNLQALGNTNIVGFDKRQDRCDEAHTKYGIATFTAFGEAVKEHPFHAFIISVPPDLHHVYMSKALEMEVPAFIEASVVDTNMSDIIASAKEKHIFFAPSCTLHFHPAIKKINELVKSNALGTISNYLYHSGQYLPDWHTYEAVSEYYVSKKDTGGGREIVPFELTWITLLLGIPKRVTGMYKSAIHIEGAEGIDDTYNLLLDYGSAIFNLSVDVVSRAATRRLVINGDSKQLYWNWDDNAISIFDPAKNSWELITYETISAETGYNKNITEQMYIDEVAAFLNGISDPSTYPNNLEHDHAVLKVLYAAEKSNDENVIVSL